LTVPVRRLPADAHLAAAPRAWAAGDVARAHHAEAARPIPVEHRGAALGMADVAGHNASRTEVVVPGGAGQASALPHAATAA
ncbi:NAD(P)/FAD-dependent oxidoreductase, partial [Micrococcus sp. SIMBA_131]